MGEYKYSWFSFQPVIVTNERKTEINDTNYISSENEEKCMANYLGIGNKIADKIISQ